MLDRELWLEIFEALGKNPLRTMLTALSVAWGIFVLVLLLAAGAGLEHSAEWHFRDDAVNSIWVYPGRRSQPHRGHEVGRPVQLTNQDHIQLQARVRGVDHITSRFDRDRAFFVRHGNHVASFDVRACHPDHLYLERTQVVRGRFLNVLDLRERRKVAVIGRAVVETLFSGGDALGQWIDVGGTAYRVIGVFEDEGGEGELRKIYVPITTAQMVYGGGERVDQIMFTVGGANAEASDIIEKDTRELLAGRHAFSSRDRHAVWIRNNLQNYREITSVLQAIRVFVWFTGLGTILAGIVGVSNIMLISVKERTREIGLRKALGATRVSMLRLVLQEAVLLTTAAGYLGLVTGVVVVEIYNRYLPVFEGFRHPTVDIGTALWATVVLIVAGVAAGAVPALRAARINPVTALRDE